MSVTLDDGTAVVGETEVAIDAGERVLVVGESGAGKSTLIRAIAGLWPWGEGQVLIRRGAKLFFMPQRRLCADRDAETGCRLSPLGRGSLPTRLSSKR